MKEKIKSREELVGIVEGLKKQGKRIVTTNGCFDIIHAGHASYLSEAKKLGDVLIVGLNSDASVKKYKGPERPWMSHDDRALMLASMDAVDFVTIFDEDTSIPLMSVIKPHIHVKGGDYTPEKMCETKTVIHHGGKVVILPYLEGRSTTALVARIRDGKNLQT